jgi:hypothetical protein
MGVFPEMSAGEKDHLISLAFRCLHFFCYFLVTFTKIFRYFASGNNK